MADTSQTSFVDPNFDLEKAKVELRKMMPDMKRSIDAVRNARAATHRMFVPPRAGK